MPVKVDRGSNSTEREEVVLHVQQRRPLSDNRRETGERSLGFRKPRMHTSLTLDATQIPGCSLASRCGTAAGSPARARVAGAQRWLRRAAPSLRQRLLAEAQCPGLQLLRASENPEARHKQASRGRESAELPGRGCDHLASAKGSLKSLGTGAGVQSCARFYCVLLDRLVLRSGSEKGLIIFKRFSGICQTLGNHSLQIQDDRGPTCDPQAPDRRPRVRVPWRPSWMSMKTHCPVRPSCRPVALAWASPILVS